MHKRFLALVLSLVLAISLSSFALAYEGINLEAPFPDAIEVSATMRNLPAQSAILISQNTGQVLFEQNPDIALPPASITKIMTMLLVIEAIEAGRIKLDDVVVCSPYAASRGGSQIWLAPGEEMTVHELFKAVAISSANDAAVALAEHVAGSEEVFAAQMNQRAVQLGMRNSNFVNACGLDAAGHVTTARDVALMSRELMKHPVITEYSTIWMDSLRGGETELVNTNRLVRFYAGTTGLKTGTTAGAGSCLAATATRDGLGFVAVVMGSATSDDRFAAARGLLDYGFANYILAPVPPVQEQIVPTRVLRGMSDSVQGVAEPPADLMVKRGQEDKIEQRITLVSDVQAPVTAGQTLGRVEILVEGEPAGEYLILADRDIRRMHLGGAFLRMLGGAVNIK